MDLPKECFQECGGNLGIVSFQQDFQLPHKLLFTNDSRRLIADPMRSQSPSHPHAAVKLIPVGFGEPLKESGSFGNDLGDKGVGFAVKTLRIPEWIEADQWIGFGNLIEGGRPGIDGILGRGFPDHRQGFIHQTMEIKIEGLGKTLESAESRVLGPSPFEVEQSRPGNPSLTGEFLAGPSSAQPLSFKLNLD